jgi:hypothetical protein
MARFKSEAQHVGNATLHHVAAWVQHQDTFTGLECPNSTFQMLSNGRFYEGNHSAALNYGPVMGNVTAKSKKCIVPYMQVNNLMPPGASGQQDKRFLTSLFANAAAWISGFGFAGQLFNVGCNIYNAVTNASKVGKAICTGASLLTAIGGGWDFQNKLRTSTTQTVGDPSWQSYDLEYFHPNSNIEGGLGINPSKRSDDTFDYNQTMHLRHGTEDRNLTWAEYFSANSTHRGSVYYDGSYGGVASSLEFWHQPHPTNSTWWSTHIGTSLSGIVNNSAGVSEKTKRDNTGTWCDGSQAFNGWEPDDATFEVLECNYDDVNGQMSGGGPGMLYYGFDAYAPNENSAFGWDMGPANTEVRPIFTLKCLFFFFGGKLS